MVTGFEPAQPDPLLPVFEQWHTAAVAAQSLWVRSLGALAIAAAAKARFDALVRFARSRSPFYRSAWAGLHDGPLELAEQLDVRRSGSDTAPSDREDQWGPPAHMPARPLLSSAGPVP
jgi:hypothetical protein